MRGVQLKVGIQKPAKVTKGVWEVILTDPSLNKFTFGPTLISRYVMTDIISPYGQKSILYNTIPNEEHGAISISLNFEDIDDGNISDIQFRASNAFYDKWKVTLVDNRTSDEHSLTEDDDFEVEPPIQFNKIFSMGFIPENQKNGNNFFELRLTLK
jgi:hypothetical protein